MLHYYCARVASMSSTEHEPGGTQAPTPCKVPPLATIRFRARTRPSLTELNNKLEFELALLPSLLEILGSHGLDAAILPWTHQPARIYGKSVCLDIHIYCRTTLAKLQEAAPHHRLQLKFGGNQFPEALLSWEGISMTRHLLMYPAPQAPNFDQIKTTLEEHYNLIIQDIQRAPFFFRNGARLQGLTAPQHIGFFTPE